MPNTQRNNAFEAEIGTNFCSALSAVASRFHITELSRAAGPETAAEPPAPVSEQLDKH